MKILFVENRYKTKLWEIIGREYEKLGHEIYWIVQNHMFKPSYGKIVLLPYPSPLKQEKIYTPEIKKIIAADRGLNYFGLKSDDFIFWYNNEIDLAINTIEPELVFGESTLFHELLVINACKKREILYLHPSSCRYPTNRFSFYKYDTLVPFGRSGDKMPIEEAKETAYAIGKRLKLPDYMNVKKQSLSKYQWIKDKVKLTTGYFLGERYNTPSPFMKRKITKYFASNIAKWDELGTDVNKLEDAFYILYPLQMQPESNIDVWGYPYNNQAEVVKWIVDHLKEGEKLILKPNPKSKYEISEALLGLISNNLEKVIVLKHSSRMEEIWSNINLVVTVTGTISIECIFDNKPVVMLGQGLQANQKNCIALNMNSDMRKVVEEIKLGTFPTLTDYEKVSFLNELVDTSFTGVNGDGLHNKAYLEDKLNMDAVIEAYKGILK
jgi:hypothetical protein